MIPTPASFLGSKRGGAGAGAGRSPYGPAPAVGCRTASLSVGMVRGTPAPMRTTHVTTASTCTTTSLGLTTAVGTAASMALAERRASQTAAGAPYAVPEERVLLYDEALPYVEVFEGPIMFTAPHGLELFRGGAFGERTRVHYRERWVSEIVLKLSQAVARKLHLLMGSTSYLIWNCATAKKQDASNLDPNYLIEADFPNSPWHQALVKWKALFADTGIPLLHVDLHGKLDRKDNLDIDVGTGAMEELWGPARDVARALKTVTSEELEKALENRRSYGYKQLKMGVERNPQLRGYNDRGFHTMAHQSVLLGIPAVQLELPKTVRKALMIEHSFLDRFADALAATYVRVFHQGKLPKLTSLTVPAHYPTSFRRQLEQRLAEEAEAAAKARERRRTKPDRTGGAPAVVAPQPAKMTRCAALARQLLQDLAQLEATCEDKQI
eukprot:TRINITY_DN9423_c0_g1_i1.p1 TRINITY_DN9423_c0_g1~~TRINITY_DN9423_c0_g1_i1.p1  ORF type:complete len:439 (+),score=153.72 TRINITY_DN9423_c0_g1_i1:113-1429(+)